jgi:hypothetical protein
MTKQSSHSKKDKKGDDRMIPYAIRLSVGDLNQAKTKAGIVPLSKYIRTLILMWLHGDVKVTDEDVKKYN